METKEKIKEIMNKIVSVSNMRGNSGREVPNQFRISGDGWALLQSYRSPIAMVYHGITYIFKNYDYSQTTGVYRNQFLGEGIAETRAKLKSGEYIAVDFEVE